MVHVASLAILAVLCLSLAQASIGTARLKTGESFLIREAENAGALARNVASGHQKMEFSGRNRGKWVDDKGRVVNSSNFRLYRNGSVLMKHARIADAGTYQKDPNPMIRIGDMGYAPPILIIQVDN
ncbi:hypothetical protein GCK72_006934 [Caenorhabditis remanei]|uniref:Uncharacterized protein n=1 Tax=Caenorhabditis remanei TaxID=31234 RepID=E3M1M7_CAERE|nr:hypothetical protein GCK72_006934 [Caenorhabditis remanei]EFO88767.1 hypothetical protein CRE_06580 [Caenorhabditis remanei]KAF1766976.1 hypothetical protein GCK72_006934 [Caenorhabditis remanei]